MPNTHNRNNSQSIGLGYNLDRQKIVLSVDRYRLSTQTYYDGDMESFSVRLPKVEREKIGLFYDYDIGGEFLKSLHLDAYNQTIARKFENDLVTTQVIPSPQIQALTITNQTRTNDKQYTQGVTLQSNYTLPASNNLVLGAQYLRDKITQTSNGYTRQAAATGLFDIETKIQRSRQGYPA